MPEYLRTRNAAAMAEFSAEHRFSWSGSRRDLKTYWGDRSVAVSVIGKIPDNWKHVGDACWRVDGETSDGKPIPYLGMLRRYTNVKQTQLAKIVPPLNMNAVPDGLYLTLEPRVKTADSGGIIQVRPLVYLCEIRDHVFQPFRVKIPLIPDQPSSLTPPPKIKKRPPAFEGTPFPVD